MALLRRIWLVGWVVGGADTLGGWMVTPNMVMEKATPNIP